MGNDANICFTRLASILVGKNGANVVVVHWPGSDVTYHLLLSDSQFSAIVESLAVICWDTVDYYYYYHYFM